MYISLNWINDYVDLKGVDLEKLINQFTLSCAEVEGYERKGDKFSGVVTGKIVSVENHPNSKKLHLLKVDVKKEVLDIVCGAPNVKEGIIVPVALDGAKIGNIEIRPALVGGYTSYGMCCSAKELDITDDNSGLLVLPEETPIGVDLKEVLPVEDIIFEIDNKSLTNRPDMWGHYGIAREISALLGRPLKKVPVYDGQWGKNKVNVKVESESCYRYTSATMDNITRNISPLEMQIRLYYAGMRPINFLADITNYIMLELGQPMHSFDNNDVREIGVLDVKQETEFMTLDKEKRTLAKDTMVITNGKEPVAIAGIMGGLDSEIKDNTTSVLIESACFNGAKVRKTAVSLGLRTEASARYEKMLDPELTMTALKRFVYIVKKYDKDAKITSDITDVYNYQYPAKTIEITKEYIDNFVGMEIDKKRIIDILSALQFDVKENGNIFTIKVPTFRNTKDINGKQDIVEEITRIYGYDNIQPKSTLQVIAPQKLDKQISLEYDVKYALANRYNMHEVHSYIWYDSESNAYFNIKPKSEVKIVNAINKENDEIRSTMLPSMLKVIYDNKATYSNFGVFEIGRVVTGIGKDNLVKEEKSLAFALYDKQGQNGLLKAKEIVDYILKYVVKCDVKYIPAKPKQEYLSPANYYEIVVDGKALGLIASLHPANKPDTKCDITLCEINWDMLVSAEEKQTKFAQVSKYPKSELDFNFLLPKDTNYNEIEKIAYSVSADFDYNVTLLDVYEMENAKSYTLHYELVSYTRTLIAEEIEEFHKKVIGVFAENNINLKL